MKYAIGDIVKAKFNSQSPVICYAGIVSIDGSVYNVRTGVGGDGFCQIKEQDIVGIPGLVAHVNSNKIKDIDATAEIFNKCEELLLLIPPGAIQNNLYNVGDLLLKYKDSTWLWFPDLKQINANHDSVVKKSFDQLFNENLPTLVQWCGILDPKTTTIDLGQSDLLRAHAQSLLLNSGLLSSVTNDPYFKLLNEFSRGATFATQDLYEYLKKKQTTKIVAIGAAGILVSWILYRFLNKDKQT